MDLRTCALEIIQNLLETERGPTLVMLNGAFTPGPVQRLQYVAAADRCFVFVPVLRLCQTAVLLFYIGFSLCAEAKMIDGRRGKLFHV